MMHRWQLQDAKARFSEVVKSAATEGPQEITVRGKPAAVVLSKDEYQRLIGQKPTLADFLRQSPLHGMELDIERDRSTDREVTF
jgi:antitoxin Phd